MIEVKITTLSENTANYGFLAEWGLSILIEADGKTILLDTGLSTSAIQNAGKLGVDFSKIDCIVLSHGHADHTGGLRDILKLTGEIEIIAHPDIFTQKYTRRDSAGREQYIGLPYSRDELESLGARFNLSKDPVHISENILTTGVIPMVTDYEVIDDNLFVKDNGALVHDPLADDLALVVDTEFGLVVILGCAHRGIINTLKHAQQITGKELVYAAIGGTHLFRASRERIENTITDLKTMGIQRLGVSHCTGHRASAKLFHELGEVFFPNNAGTRFILP